MGQTMKTVDVTMYPDGRLDTVNAAKYLGRSKKTLDCWRVNGTGPKFIKTGGARVFYFLTDLDEWLNGARVTSTAAARLAINK